MDIDIAWLADRITDYEEGETTDAETLELFSYLIRTGHAYRIQGRYGRIAEDLIADGWLDYDGTYTEKARELIENL